MSIDHSCALAEMARFRDPKNEAALILFWSVGGNEFRARSRKLLERTEKFPLVCALLNTDIIVSRHDGMGLALYHIPRTIGLDLTARCHLDGVPMFWGGEID